MSTSDTDNPRSLATEDKLGPNGDDMYAALLRAHTDLSDEQSARLNARLVLLLMNQVADPEIFDQVLKTAGSIELADSGRSVRTS